MAIRIIRAFLSDIVGLYEELNGVRIDPSSSGFSDW